MKLLIIGLTTDNFNKIKNRKYLIPYEDRKEMLLSIKYVDRVFPKIIGNKKVLKYQNKSSNLCNRK